MPKAVIPPAIVIFGEERFEKAERTRRAMDDLLPPEVDRGMALCEYDGAAREDQGGPVFAAVADDLRTLPFLSDRRVVVIREADAFISASREPLERYFDSPAPSATLVLECRTFPKTTRLYKAVARAGGVLVECKKLSQRDAVDFVFNQARSLGKRIEPAAANKLAELIGAEAGALASEVEKLAMYAGDRPQITADDVRELVGLSREEKIFAVMDAALLGRTDDALRLWRQVLATDPAGVYKALGGMAFVIRRLMAAHRMAAGGMSLSLIAPKVMMFRREAELRQELKRNPAARLETLLADMAELDKRAKLGLRSLEVGIESLLFAISHPAA